MIDYAVALAARYQKGFLRKTLEKMRVSVAITPKGNPSMWMSLGKEADALLTAPRGSARFWPQSDVVHGQITLSLHFGQSIVI